MATLPKISIVIPSFNQGKYIGETLQSIVDQDYPETEIIVIDGASKDETTEIIRKYEKYISYWVSEADRGQAHAINKGLEKVTGQIFNWINSDDYLEPGALHSIADYFIQHPDKNVLCGYTRCFFEDTKQTSHEYRMGIQQNVADTILNVEMNQPGTFYRTAIVKEFGGVNESLRYVFDDELWFRYLCKYGLKSLGFSDKRFAQFRLHGSSKSIAEGFDLFNKEIQRIYIDIAANLNAPQWMLSLMGQASPADTYHSSGKWDLGKLNAKRFLGVFAARYINWLYLNGKKKEAKEAMKFIINGDSFEWNRKLLSLRIKLALA